jgi:hypothetical protein
VSVPEPEKFDVELGPLFAAGVLLVVYGLVRRKALAAAAGLGAIWLDQRSELGRSIREKAKGKFMPVQVEDDGEETGGPG